MLFLTVHPGYYGSQFIIEVLDKVVELRKLLPDINISVDGGINESNIIEIARTGANVFNVGSDIFLHPKLAEKYSNLVALLNINED